MLYKNNYICEPCPIDIVKQSLYAYCLSLLRVFIIIGLFGSNYHYYNVDLVDYIGFISLRFINMNYLGFININPIIFDMIV